MRKFINSILLFALVLLAPVRVLADGYTPTDGGLVVNLKPNDQILISVMVDHDNNAETPDREYFLGNYTRYNGDDYFTYAGGYFLKLFQQDAHATEPSSMTIWTVDSALTRVDTKGVVAKNRDFSLGGISYTIWNDGRTLKTANDRWRFYGDLESDPNNDRLCDVAFVIPTVRATTDFDPNGTLNASHTKEERHKGTDGQSWAFDGKTGRGFLGMTYREVYMLEIPRFNGPVSYTNAALVTFNTTQSPIRWSAIGQDVASGRAGYVYADKTNQKPHHRTQRTIFRLYILNDPFVTCPDSYFFAYDEQNTLKYRKTNNVPGASADSTGAKKIYTNDHLFPMKRVGSTKYYQTDPMNVPVPDSSYYYVGWHDSYRSAIADLTMGSGDPGAHSQFTKIRTLPMNDKEGFIAPAGAHGRMIADTTSSADNLNVKFIPTGYFFRTSNGMNVQLRQVDDSTWMAEKMWHIEDDFMELSGKVTLYTGSSFSMEDKGADIARWTEMVAAPLIPVVGKPTETAEHKYGWPRIHTNRSAKNGGIEFVEADTSQYIHYDNNGHFGSDIPDQYATTTYSKVAVQSPRLITGYDFICWTDRADTTEGEFHKYNPGDSVTLSGALTLYAQAKYTGTINVAISFLKDGKRYFLTHPNINAPRYARARHFEDWTEVHQGLSDALNSDPNYMSSFNILGKEGICEKCGEGEYVLDPHREVMRGTEDSLIFYGDYAPNTEEYIGLYYLSNPNTVIANSTWAGLFTSSEGWPTPANPCIPSTRLSSTHYLGRNAENQITRYARVDSLTNPSIKDTLSANIVYNDADDQFDGTDGPGTEFMLSGVGVVDAHYVIIPDTNEIWRDTIVFGNITDPHPRETVISKLIGKHLLAQMTIGSEIVYFHPDRDRTYTTANELRLSPYYRLTQNFTFIPDARVTTLDEDDRPRMENAGGFSCEVVGGHSNPMNVRYNDEYIDIVDTLRISLTQGGISKIKKYYDRWGDDAVDSVLPGGLTRYRDVIIRTKTLHYGATHTHLVLTPEKDKYIFSPLKDDTKSINFTLTKVTSRPLLDADDNVIREEVFASEDVTTSLALTPSVCRLATDSLKIDGAVSQQVTISTEANNKEGDNLDTLVISATVRIDGVDYPATARVPLLQTSLEGDELVWSVYEGKQRYYIMAGTGGLIFRKFKQSGSTLYKDGSTTALVKGSANPANNDAKYITPWHFDYNPVNVNQLSLKTEDPVNRYIKMLGEDVGSQADIDDKTGSYFTFHYVNVYTNSNANEEEQVKLQYGDKWLKFTLTGGSGAELNLVSSKEEASVFSWSYLKQEYNLLNNGDYPSRDLVTFGYNNGASTTVQTRYKAFKEYSMLVGNEMVNLCREEETVIANLVNSDKEWLTNTAFAIIPDARSFTDEKGDALVVESGLSRTTDPATLITTVTPASATSPRNVKCDGKFVNIVDTLQVTLSTTREDYRFTSWEGVSSISDACLKIPLVRKTYHEDRYDSITCIEKNEEYNHVFPNTVAGSVSYTFELATKKRTGAHVLDVDNIAVAVQSVTETDMTKQMNLSNKLVAEIQLIDPLGNTPTWCNISAKGDSSITVTCTESGIRTPRTAYIYLAYIVMDDEKMRFVNYRLTVSQPSLFDYANNQHLVHSSGASGDPIDPVTGMQQVHENKRILYYYPDQDVELPIRENHFFGWWRWFREGEEGIGDTDIPQEDWRTKPVNTSGKYNFPFRIIGDSVMLKKKDGTDSVKVLKTMGRYTVFHYRSKDYPDVRNNPPVKTAMVAPPITTFGVTEAEKPTVTYAVDISNYYDGLPMSVKDKNQVDTARLDTMRAIPEPTLSIRESFELHPWTEMADTLGHYKSKLKDNDEGYTTAEEHYMEDHVVMAPLGNQLLLSTEQRYNLENVQSSGHSESLLGYYMHDDNWDKWDDYTGGTAEEIAAAKRIRQDTMIWCGGWDADCEWYTYKNGKYTKSSNKITSGDDFLIVPKKNNISSGHTFDTVVYCLRARSWKTTFGGEGDPTTVAGDSMFNICRYMIIYHDPKKYGPLTESTKNGITKAIITNDEIEQRYEVLERLDFDYNKPGSGYTVYPHPLQWADASYGYTYPETPDLPHNRLHDQTALPNFGEYGLINRIGYTDYWYDMEQHGGAANGYMIYCDGMSSSGQVAALSLETHLCAGQKMFFSAYIGNPSNQNGKANPNFTFEVQGSVNGSTWEDITSYMTGDIPPSRQWYQIYFPIIFNEAKNYSHFRVRIYNMSSNWDGNDFTIDDMCLFATKPPLIAYQANTACKEKADDDTPTHVILRVDYQGITGDGYNNDSAYYTVKCVNKDGRTSFVPMLDNYLKEEVHPGKEEAGVKVEPDTLCGKFFIPARTYEPADKDSIFVNMTELIDTFNLSNGVFKEGYIYEILEGEIRPVKYMIHHAYMNPADTFTVHMSAEYSDLLSSICGMTSYLKVSNQMVLELNGEEVPDINQDDLCANATYDMGLRVKGSLYLDSIAPISLNGTCYNDWLLYGDTAEVSSEARYGYKYSDIVKVVKDILRCEPKTTNNANQFAPNLAAVSRNEMQRIMNDENVKLSVATHPYDILAHLVNNGFLTLYQSHLTATVYAGDSVKYVIFPIVGTGTDALHASHVEVCPLPILILLKPDPESAKAPLIVGGLHRAASEMNQPIVVLASGTNANHEITLHVDSIMPLVGIRTVELLSTDDPDFREGVHSLTFIPDMDYPAEDYYVKGSDIILRASNTNNYFMRPGYTYTYGIVMETILGKDTLDGGCPVGTVPFTLSVVPDYLRWDPQDESSNQWNKPGNWMCIDQNNQPLATSSRYAPLASTSVIIPAMTDGRPYPELPNLDVPSTYDSVQQVGFVYNKCDYIRFLPGAAISHQQRMEYNQAIVDMPLPHNQWAFRSAPVKGMISGDLFMADADLNYGTTPWEVGEFDADGRTYKTGNATYWLSLYSTNTVRKVDGTTEEERTADAEWSKVTNGMTLSLPPAQGFAVYSRTKSNNAAAVRLPKNDDVYYYYDKYGERQDDMYEHNLRTLRETNAVAQGGHAGDLTFTPGNNENQSYTITKGVGSQTFVFGNPTMGYIDIWGFIADNNLKKEIGYMGANNVYTTITKAAAEATDDTITNQARYLPPMYAIIVTDTLNGDAPTSLSVRVDTNRVLISPERKVRPLAPKYGVGSKYPQGIMTVTATNTVSPRCLSRLLVGQGYHDALYEGEDAVLTTLNIDNYTNNTTPATPFNLYAAEGNYGLCIDLRDSIVNIPLSFFLSDLPFDETTRLWFTGVHNISDSLVLYDAVTDTERQIADGVYIDIHTPEKSHQVRYYIRRRGFKPDDSYENPVYTGFGSTEQEVDRAVKIIRNGHVYILRNGHVYTALGQKIQ